MGEKFYPNVDTHEFTLAALKELYELSHRNYRIAKKARTMALTNRFLILGLGYGIFSVYVELALKKREKDTE